MRLVRADPPERRSRQARRTRRRKWRAWRARTDHAVRRDERTFRRHHPPTSASFAKGPSARQGTRPCVSTCLCSRRRGGRSRSGTGACPAHTRDSKPTARSGFRRRAPAARVVPLPARTRSFPIPARRAIPGTALRPHAAPPPHPADEYWVRSRPRGSGRGNARASKGLVERTGGFRLSSRPPPGDRPKSTTARERRPRARSSS